MKVMKIAKMSMRIILYIRQWIQQKSIQKKDDKDTESI